MNWYVEFRKDEVRDTYPVEARSSFRDQKSAKALEEKGLAILQVLS